MTIIDLIEKLREEIYKRTEEEPNGAYGVLESWHTEMLALNPNREYDKFNDYYYKIYGLIWGLRAAYYITKEEKDQLMEELQRISKKFYNINGAY